METAFHVALYGNGFDNQSTEALLYYIRILKYPQREDKDLAATPSHLALGS